MDQRRNDPVFNAKYNTVNNNRFGSWEYGAMIDISELVRVPNTFLLNIHPHTWQENRFLNADGTPNSGNREGGEIILLKGVPR
jgi:hypothetical protein